MPVLLLLFAGRPNLAQMASDDVHIDLEGDDKDLGYEAMEEDVGRRVKGRGSGQKRDTERLGGSSDITSSDAYAPARCMSIFFLNLCCFYFY